MMTDENRESTMTKRESLRDRIIAALSRADQDWCSDNNLYEDMADAVIHELGNLRLEQHRFECRDDCDQYRIVSDWTTER